MYYTVSHLTRFRYHKAISESVMETRMHPRSDERQRCLMFHLSVSPRSRVFSYRDHLGNQIHHFDVPGLHTQLTIIAESTVDLQGQSPLPPALGADAWGEIDALVENGDYWEMLLPSEFAQPTPLLHDLARFLDVRRRDDPLTVLSQINRALYETFDYVPRSTKVDSPIDHALELRKGVCQDFAHIMIALVRTLGIPCRYVSGYLHHRSSDHDRSAEGATHAWVEALLPHLGWVGFDPTNSLIAGERHIRTAIGRDYADVPPTKGIYRGPTESELTVGVRVQPSQDLPSIDPARPIPEEWSVLFERAPDPPQSAFAQMQQQQQ
ncbi:MAG: transglutaminase family protein [Bryobacteraceae bacterium]